jgi:hypothetical protein
MQFVCASKPASSLAAQVLLMAATAGTTLVSLRALARKEKLD